MAGDGGIPDPVQPAGDICQPAVDKPDDDFHGQRIGTVLGHTEQKVRTFKKKGSSSRFWTILSMSVSSTPWKYA